MSQSPARPKGANRDDRAVMAEGLAHWLRGRAEAAESNAMHDPDWQAARRFMTSAANYRTAADFLDAHDKLVAALRDLEKSYTELIESGDAGFFDPADVPCIAAARALLAGLGREGK